MATTSDLIRAIDGSLWAISAEADFLPELAADWDQEDAYTRAEWENEWDVLFMRLRGLDDAYHSGEMTEEQRARYHELRAKLRNLLPLFERLGLPRPAIPLDP